MLLVAFWHCACHCWWSSLAGALFACVVVLRLWCCARVVVRSVSETFASARSCSGFLRIALSVPEGGMSVKLCLGDADRYCGLALASIDAVVLHTYGLSPWRGAQVRSGWSFGGNLVKGDLRSPRPVVYAVCSHIRSRPNDALRAEATRAIISNVRTGCGLDFGSAWQRGR